MGEARGDAGSGGQSGASRRATSAICRTKRRSVAIRSRTCETKAAESKLWWLRWHAASCQDPNDPAAPRMRGATPSHRASGQPRNRHHSALDTVRRSAVALPQRAVEERQQPATRGRARTQLRACGAGGEEAKHAPRSGCKACAGPGSGDSLHTHPASAGSGCCAPVARRAPPHTNTSLPARGNATMLLSSCGSRQGAACNLLGGLARGPPRRPSLHASLPAAGGPRALRSVITRVSPTPQQAARTLSPLMRTAAGRRRLAPPCPSPDGATCSPS